MPVALVFAPMVRATPSSEAATYKSNTTGLCRFLTEKFRDESLEGYLDDEKAITHILSSILPRMIRIISYDQDMVFDFILQLAHRIGTAEKKIEELQRLLTEFDRTKQQEHPVFISDLPFSPSEHFIGRENELENVWANWWNICIDNDYCGYL